MSTKILVIAGEASSDLHTSNLITQIKRSRPDTTFYGLGGDKMRETGAEIIYNIVDLAVIGFVEVIKHYRLFRKIFYSLIERVKSDRPSLVILVDYPGFNLRLAKEIKKLGIPIIYYISPQVWAWGKDRVKIIRRLVDKMMVIFKFEEEFYKRHGIDAVFVGHPLLDTIPASFDKNAILKDAALDINNKTVSLMPGSREGEVRRILPIMLKTTASIQKELGDINFVILKSSTLNDSIYKELLDGFNLNIKTVEGKNYELISASDLVLVASGTATVETAILKRPMIIIYKISSLTYLLLRLVIRLPFIGMVNIVAGKKIISEYLQYNANPKKIAKEAIDILSNPPLSEKITQDLAAVKSLLGNPGASKRAADIVLDFLKT